MRRIAVLGLAAAMACSFSEDFGRFAAGDAFDGGQPGTHDASSVDAERNDTGPGPAPHDCKGSDPAVLLCADFEVDAVEQGFGPLLFSTPSDTARLDTVLFRSATRAARFSSPNGGEHFVYLPKQIPRTDRIEVSGWAYLDVSSLADMGTVAVLSIAYTGPVDVLKLRFAPDNSDVSLLMDTFDKYPLSEQPPRRRFFHFAVMRDELSRVVSVSLDGRRVLPPTRVNGSRPSTGDSSFASASSTPSTPRRRSASSWTTSKFARFSDDASHAGVESSATPIQMPRPRAGRCHAG